MAGQSVSFSIFLKDYFSGALDKAANKGDQFENEVGKNFKNAEKAGKNAAKGVESGWSGAFNVIKNLALTIGSGALVKSAISAAGAFETTNIKFGVFLGSAEKATAMIKELDAYSLRTPFSPDQVNDAATTLLNFGVDAKSIMPVISQLGDISAGDGQKFSSLGLVFGQVSAAGKLMGQDLLQFINAGFNPLKVLSDATGESMNSLKDKMSKGEIGVDQVAEAMRLATSEGGLFYGMSEKIAGTYEGKLSTATGNWTAMLRAMGNQILPSVNGLLDTFNNGWTKMLPVIEQVGKVIGWVVGNLGSIITVLSPLLAMFTAWYVVTEIVTAAQWLLNIALAANPVGLVIAAIGLLIGGLILAYQKSETFRNVINGLWESMKVLYEEVLVPVGMFLKSAFLVYLEAVTWYINLWIDGFKKVGQVIRSVFSGGSGWIKNIFGGALEWVGEKLKGFISFLGSIADALGITNIVNKTIAAFNKGFAGGGSSSESDPDSSGAPGSTDFASVIGGAKSTAKKGAGTKLPGVAGDTKVARNLTINIDGLIKELTISSTNIQESEGKLKDMVSKALIEAVRDFELSY